MATPHCSLFHPLASNTSSSIWGLNPRTPPWCLAENVGLRRCSLKGYSMRMCLKDSIKGKAFLGSFLWECQYTNKRLWFSEVSRHMAEGRGWREGGVNSLEWDGGLGMSIINLISLQTQPSLLLNNPLTSSGLIKGVTWTHTSNTPVCQLIDWHSQAL